MEYYSIFSHGVLMDNKKLRPIERTIENNSIPIIMFGTQSFFTVNSLTIFYYLFFTKHYGSPFLQEFLSALLQHPVHHLKKYILPDNPTMFQKAVRYLFDMNEKEQQYFPQNKFKVFVSKDVVRQPMDIYLDGKNEMVVGKVQHIPKELENSVEKKVKRLDPIFDSIPPGMMGSIPMMKRTKKMKFQFGKTDESLGFIYPYGLYKTNHLHNLHFENYVNGRLSQITTNLIQKIVSKNEQKQMYKHPKFLEIGALFVFSCKNQRYENIKNVQFAQQQQDDNPPVKTLKILYNEQTKKFQVRPKTNPVHQYQEMVSNKWKQIEKKRTKRTQKKNVIHEHELQNLFEQNI